MSTKLNLQEEIRRITGENAALATAKALEVAEQAKTRAAEVSSLAIAKALEAATLAAQKAAEAASAASSIAAATSKDLEYMRKDIAETKTDVREIKEKLDNKYTTKEEFSDHIRNNEKEKTDLAKVLEKLVTTDQFSTVKAVVYGMVGTILFSVLTGIMFLIVKK